MGKYQATVILAAVLVIISPPLRADELTRDTIESMTLTKDTTITPKSTTGDTISIAANTKISLRPEFPGHPITLKIRAKNLVVGANVIIDGKGAKGDDGDPQADASDFVIPGTMRQLTTYKVEQAKKTHAGKDGKPGKPGHPGSNVVIDAARIEGEKNLTIVVDGGDGGNPGPGGNGARLRLPNQTIVLSDSGSAGPVGMSGAPGDAYIGSKRKYPYIEHVSLTISGGISEGAYEAGYNWAYVKLLRARRNSNGATSDSNLDLSDIQTRLVSATGASAGTVNAVLTGVEWCLSDARADKETVTSNIFRTIWGNVGIDDLIPSTSEPSINCGSAGTDGEDKRYCSDDALMTRARLRRAEAQLRQVIETRENLRPDCKFPIGFTLTRTTPEQLGWKLDVPFARNPAVVIASVGASGLLFSDTHPSSDQTGKYFHFVTGPEVDRIQLNSLFEAIEAATAFPVAFGAKKLQHCDTGGGGSSSGCPYSESSRPGWYFDGGVFDNLPVGLALHIFETQAFDPPVVPRAARFITIDAASRRRWPLAAPRDAIPARGLGVLPSLASDFVSVSRKYELQGLYRYIGSGGGSSGFSLDSLSYSTRYLPIFGENLMGFGAFFSKEYREFDYYAGVYDALFDRASLVCIEADGLRIGREKA